MKQIKLLDCTLRDGGSINNCNFEEKTIIDILSSLNNSNIDIVEIGFLQNNINNSINCTISNNHKFFDSFLSKINNKFKAVVMINFGEFDITNLPNCNETLIDGIRLMFKKQDLKDAINYSKKIQEKGFALSLNPVSVTTYSKSDIENLIKYTNSINPSIIYIVDTYGLMDKNETFEYFEELDKGLNPEIEIGYHAHNNLQLAFSNSIEIIKKNSNRNIVIDASLYGMGKRAGNTNTELIAEYLNKNKKYSYNINELIHIIESTIVPMHKKLKWGYSLTHYIAAINKCHSDYVSYLQKKNNITLEQINNIVSNLEQEKKLTFDKNYIEEIIKKIYN